MNIHNAAAIALMFIALAVALFQCALACGAPWGEWAFGGQNPGVLPRRFRVSSALSLLVYVGQFWFFGMQASVFPNVLASVASAWLSWIFVAFFAIGTLMNAISRSVRERALWTPVVAFSLICALVVAL